MTKDTEVLEMGMKVRVMRGEYTRTAWYQVFTNIMWGKKVSERAVDRA